MVNTKVGVYMDNKEKELEQLVEKVKNESDLRFPPIFEMYATLFSLSVSILMFIFPNMLQPDTNLYTWMLKIMPQFMWAFSFFGAGMVKAVGLLLDNVALRVLGLVMSAMLYLVFTVCYAINFPAIGAVTFACMTLFTVISINIVKHTGIDK